MNDCLYSKHKEIIGKIFSHDYYVSRFLGVIASRNTNLESLIELEDPMEICSFWNSFWIALPDSGEIRREPFFEICDLAEGEYIEQTEDI